MNTVSKDLIVFAQKEITSIIMRLTKQKEEQASQISNDIVKVIDWNNSALMHKGLTWITKNYLIKRNML